MQSTSAVTFLEATARTAIAALSSWKVKTLHGQSVQRIPLAWELVGEGGANECRVPAGLAKHTNKRKADRGIGKKESKEIFRYTGVFVPAGSGM